jgi:hypothetical protein
MRTKTLLILAVVVGLAILVAGTIQLLRVDDSEPVDDLAIGATATAGDLEVTVVDASESDGELRVRVRVAGVDDAKGFADFVLLGGDVLEPEPPTRDDECRSLTVASQTCVLTFDTSSLTGDARVLLLRRGEDVRRWSLD